MNKALNIIMGAQSSFDKHLLKDHLFFAVSLCFVKATNANYHKKIKK